MKLRTALTGITIAAASVIPALPASAHSGYYHFTVAPAKPVTDASYRQALSNCRTKASSYLSWLRSTGHLYAVVNNCVYSSAVYVFDVHYWHPANSSGGW
jgi:hypothetical protein